MRKQVTKHYVLRSTCFYLWLGNILDPTPTKKLEASTKYETHQDRTALYWDW